MSVAQAPVSGAGRGGSDTADRIVAEALTAFASRGVEATSLDAVAAAVGIRKQTILYWFPSKEALLFAVIDRAVAELGDELTRAVLSAEGELPHQVAAAIDATFRMGRTRPELLALVREVARVGPPALTHLGTALEPLVDAAAMSISGATPTVDRIQARRLLVEVGAGVVGLATEAEMRAALGEPPGLAWLRRRRAALLTDLTSRLA